VPVVEPVEAEIVAPVLAEVEEAGEVVDKPVEAVAVINKKLLQYIERGGERYRDYQ
jgi:hypothetical protein